MALTEYGVNHPLAVKKWSMELGRDVLQDTYLAPFMGESSDSLIQVKTELTKSPGDRITFGLRNLLTGDGVVNDETLKGNEEALVTNDDSIYIQQLRHAVKSKGKMSEQRVPFSVRDEAKDGLSNWWKERFEVIGFNHLCGYTPETRLQYNGGNTITAPTLKLYSSVDHTSDETLDSSDTFYLSVIDAAVEKIRTTTPRIRPLRLGGKDYYVLFLHEYCATDLRREVSATSGPAWFNIQRSAMEGGKITGNPIFTTALGEYHGVILHRSKYLTYGVNSSTGAAITTVRRNVLCGAQAACIAFGRDNGPTRFNWVEELDDYQNQLGVKAGSIFGVKKTTFRIEDDSAAAFDYGAMVISSYGAAHTY